MGRPPEEAEVRRFVRLAESLKKSAASAVTTPTVVRTDTLVLAHEYPVLAESWLAQAKVIEALRESLAAVLLRDGRTLGEAREQVEAVCVATVGETETPAEQKP